VYQILKNLSKFIHVLTGKMQIQMLALCT